MNRKQFILLLAALVIIGGVCLALLKRNEDSWNSSDNQIGRKLLNHFQINDVAAIHIKGDSDLLLTRKDDGWHVHERGDYPANLAQIRELLFKMGDIKIAQSDDIESSQLARLDLEQPGKGSNSAVLLEFKNARGKTLDSVLLGRQHMEKSDRPSPSPFGGGGYPDGRYVMLPGDSKTLLTVSDPLTSVDPKCAPWEDKDFVKITNPSAITYVSTNASNSWTLTRTNATAPWILEQARPGEKLDTNKLASLANAMTYADFTDVLTNTAPDKTGLDKPRVVTIETFDHLTYTLKVGSKTTNNEYAMTVAVTGEIPSARTPGKDEKPEEKAKLDKDFQDKNKPLWAKLDKEKSLAKWTYLVNSWRVDQLTRDRSQLMAVDKPAKSLKPGEKEAAPEPEPAPPDDGMDILPPMKR